MKLTKDIVLRVLGRIKFETGQMGDQYLKDIEVQSPAVLVTCPYHDNHNEEKAACGVFIQNHGTFHIGDFHCFVCEKTGNFQTLIKDCYHMSIEDASKWLNDNYGDDKPDKYFLEEWDVKDDKGGTFLDPKILNQFNKYHEYMWKRRLTKEVVDKFMIGYDNVNNSITFPVWDDKGRLKFITGRSVTSKRFFIPKDVEKPVYLLNYIKENCITSHVYICESQINTLTCYSYDKNAVGLFGTGTQKQIDLLNRSGVSHFILALDPDEAGAKGTEKLIKQLRKDKIVDVMIVPQGKDINDLTREEFDACEIIDGYEWLRKYRGLSNINNKEF